MIGHDHVSVADLFVGAQGFVHIYIALVGEGLDEIAETAADIAEVDVEDFVALPEVADDIADLVVGFFEHFADRALAEVEAVVGVFGDLNEALESVDIAHDPVDAAQTLGPGYRRVVRVAAEADFVFGGNWNDALEKISDALPHGVGVDAAGFGQRLLRGVGVDEGAILRAAAARHVAGADDAEIVEVVLHGGDAGLGGMADGVADRIEGLVAVVGAEHDGAPGVALVDADVTEGDHVEDEAVGLDFFAVRRQRFGGPGRGVARWRTADVVAAELHEVLVVFRGAVAGLVLGAEIHGILWVSGVGATYGIGGWGSIRDRQAEIA